MSRKRIAFFALRGIILLVFCMRSCNAQKNHVCLPSSCGDISNISFPFRLNDDRDKCSGPAIELACQENRTILSLNSGKYYVKSINYSHLSLRVVDPGVEKNDCTSFPYIGQDGPYFLFAANIPILFISCPAPVDSSEYIDSSFCSKNRSISSSYSSQTYTYVALGETMKISDLKDSCSVDFVTWISRDGPTVNRSFSSIHDGLAYGFDLSLKSLFCVECAAYKDCCSWDESNHRFCESECRAGFQGVFWFRLQALMLYASEFIALIVAAKFFPGILCLFVLLVYKWRRRHLSMYEIIEDFLQGDNHLRPIRYTYSEIRKMTNGFKEKLGEGGYGTVFKGKLRSGLLVAVKMMNKSNTSYQEFISEVSTIGRIHHGNVVRLIGYCAQGSKRSLVYEFMPNGSLEKYIFLDQEEENGLIMSCEKMFEISLGVARAIDYLHRGCDMQILHFDIKPHNILLDENFTPKISDFGLAKLYPTEDITVPLTAARGTIGYMAPELFYRNIGGVSYKVDVYSFGMLLLEMAGRRKNVNPIVEQLSQIYFPSWVYDQINQGKNIELGETTECEKMMVKKMIIVALWCIQMKPTDRPCMSKAVEMLEGDVDILSMPPKPFICPPKM